MRNKIDLTDNELKEALRSLQARVDYDTYFTKGSAKIFNNLSAKLYDEACKRKLLN